VAIDFLVIASAHFVTYSLIPKRGSSLSKLAGWFILMMAGLGAAAAIIILANN
jgi:hypothetical protein